MSNKDYASFKDFNGSEVLTLVKPIPDDGYTEALIYMGTSSYQISVNLSRQQILDMIEELQDCVRRIERAERKDGIALKKRVLKRLVELYAPPTLIRSFRGKTIPEWHSAALLEPDGFVLKLLATSLRIDEWREVLETPSSGLTKWVKSKPLDYWLELMGVINADVS